MKEIHSFYIYQNEVTNENFYKFIKEANYNYPYIKELRIYEKRNFPIVKASFYDAKNYCKWTTMRLPEELEWEKAARGNGIVKTNPDNNDQNIYTNTAIDYPWGNIFNENYCNFFQGNENDLLPIDMLPSRGKSPYNVLGMCGNAPEWTSSWYNAYEKSGFESEFFGKQFKVIRGWAYNEASANMANRFRGGYPNLAADYAGFRCVKELE